jgi:hypothetical protein
MADNVTITPGSGASVAADDIDGVLYQRVKLIEGADGVNNGDVSASNPLPTQEAGGALSLLTRIANLLMSPMGFDRSLSRQRVTAVVESGTVTTVTTVTTVATVTNLSTIDTIQGRLLPLNQNTSAWAASVRSCIT